MCQKRLLELLQKSEDNFVKRGENARYVLTRNQKKSIINSTNANDCMNEIFSRNRQDHKKEIVYLKQNFGTLVIAGGLLNKK